MGEAPPEVGVGKLPEQREFKGYNFISEVLIPLAQAGLAGLAKAGSFGIFWMWPAILAAFVLALALDLIGASSTWIWSAALLPAAIWLIVAGMIAFAEFFELIYKRMSTEAKSWTADRPGAPIAEVRETIRYRMVFVNGRKAEVEEVTPPAEDAVEVVVDPGIMDLAEFAARAANGELAKSWWCPVNGRRIVLASGTEVSAPKWAELTGELCDKYRFITKTGRGYEWAVEPDEAIAFLNALAEGRTRNLPPYPAPTGQAVNMDHAA